MLSFVFVPVFYLWICENNISFNYTFSFKVFKSYAKMAFNKRNSHQNQNKSIIINAPCAV